MVFTCATYIPNNEIIIEAILHTVLFADMCRFYNSRCRNHKFTTSPIYSNDSLESCNLAVLLYVTFYRIKVE